MLEFINDESGKWTVRNGKKYLLIEPSAEYVSKHTKTEEQIKNDRKMEIALELSKLDTEISRIVEDIIKQGNFVIHKSKTDIITRKTELRNELNLLK